MAGNGSLSPIDQIDSLIGLYHFLLLFLWSSVWAADAKYSNPSGTILESTSALLS